MEIAEHAFVSNEVEVLIVRSEVAKHYRPVFVYDTANFPYRSCDQLGISFDPLNLHFRTGSSFTDQSRRVFESIDFAYKRNCLASKLR